jgi:hypothetical protein
MCGKKKPTGQGIGATWFSFIYKKRCSDEAVWLVVPVLSFQQITQYVLRMKIVEGFNGAHSNK